MLAVLKREIFLVKQLPSSEAVLRRYFTRFSVKFSPLGALSLRSAGASGRCLGKL